MGRIIVLTIFIITFFSRSGISGNVPAAGVHNILSLQDTSKENQILYNGRIWRNRYLLVKENQFLFSKVFIPGSLTIRGKKFTDIYLKYDIYNDEIITPVNPGGIVQLNKQLVDSFTLFFNSKTYRFIRVMDDTAKRSDVYYNVLYKGGTSLYVKYIKKIDKNTDQGNYGKFYQINKVLLVRDNKLFPIKGKNDLLEILSTDKALIKNFIRKSKIKITTKDPESIIPVIKYYESLGR